MASDHPALPEGYIGLGANQVAAYVLASAYNLLRIAKLLEAQ